MDVVRRHDTHKKIKALLVFFCLAALWNCRQRADRPVPEVVYEEGKAAALAFDVALPGPLPGVFVYGEARTPVLGHWSLSGGRHRFRPAVPFRSGQRYAVISGADSLATFRIPENPSSAAPEILAIYPSGDSLPANLLKMYIFFSRPMQETGRAPDFIRLRELGKTESSGPFLDLEAELWNSAHDRLTLWIDPGRIKTGLIPNRERGIPLEAGKTYRLSIDPRWRDAAGVPMESGYDRTFHIVEADRRPPALASWEVEPPRAGGREPLILRFGESLDAVLAGEAIAVLDPEGRYLQGDTELLGRETGLKFTPLNRWKKGSYTIVIEEKLEDLAGNRLHRLFDQDLAAGDALPPADSLFQRRFAID